MNNVSVAAEIVEVKPVPPPANTAARYVLASVVPLGGVVLVGVGVTGGVLLGVGEFEGVLVCVGVIV